MINQVRRGADVELVVLRSDRYRNNAVGVNEIHRAIKNTGSAGRVIVVLNIIDVRTSPSYKCVTVRALTSNHRFLSARSPKSQSLPIKTCPTTICQQ
jgi:hypothetical protein